MENSPDFQKLFTGVPACTLVLLPNTPKFTIIAVTDSYLAATMTKREDIIGHPLFEIFPDNPNDPTADGVLNLTASLHRAIASKKADRMAIQKYDIPKPGGVDGEFEERYWAPENTPLVEADGKIICIYHQVVDVTETEKLIREYGGPSEVKGLLDDSHERSQARRLCDILVSREIKMTELKKEIKELEKRLGGQ